MHGYHTLSIPMVEYDFVHTCINIKCAKLHLHYDLDPHNDKRVYGKTNIL